MGTRQENVRQARRQRRIAAIVLAVAACAAGCAVHLFRGRHIFPVDEATAKQRLSQHLRRQGRSVRADDIVAMPAEAVWVKRAWAFAVRNREYELVGGPVYDAMYLVGSVEHSPDRPGRWRSITVHFDETIRHQTYHHPPADEDEALAIARCYAWLATQHHPDRLRILRTGEVPEKLAAWWAKSEPHRLKAVTPQIVAPRIVRQPQAPREGPIFTVEFCTYCPDFWSDIIFWHMEIGPYLFSPSRRPIYRAPRVQE